MQNATVLSTATAPAETTAPISTTAATTIDALQLQVEQQQQRRQLQQHQRERYTQRRRQLIMLAQQQQQQQLQDIDTVPQPLSRQTPSLSNSDVIAVVVPMITSLHDALSHPEQALQIGPVRRRSLAPSAATAATATTPTSACGSHDNCRDRKRAASTLTTSATVSTDASKAATTHKKFPRALERLRDRLQHLDGRLQLDVNALRQEISDLELERSLATSSYVRPTRFDVAGSAAKVVRAYFDMFRHGFEWFPVHDSDQLTGTSTSNNNGTTDTIGAAASQQRGFLHAAVDPLLAFYKYIGRDVLTVQWQRYTQFHAGLRMQLLTLDVAASDEQRGAAASARVYTTGRLTAYMTRETLAQIFPHALRDAALTQQLIGSFIEYPFRLALDVDVAGRITSFQPDVDFVGALSKVVRNLGTVSLIMQDATISAFGMIGSLDGTPESSPRDAVTRSTLLEPVLTSNVAAPGVFENCSEEPCIAAGDTPRQALVAVAASRPTSKSAIEFLLS